jgi:hypothetical protein
MPGCVSNNNGLESTNRWIKTHFMSKTRKPLNQLLPILLDMTKTWSCDRVSLKKFSKVPTYSLKSETEAYHWIKEYKNMCNVIYQNEELEYIMYPTNTSYKLDSVESYNFLNLKVNEEIPLKRRSLTLTFFDLYVQTKKMFVILTHYKVIVLI